MEVITTLNEKILNMFPPSVAFVVGKSPIGPFTILILLSILLLGFIVLLFGFSGPTEEEASKDVPAKKRNKLALKSGPKKKVQIVAPTEEEVQFEESPGKARAAARSRNKKKTPFPTKVIPDLPSQPQKAKDGQK
jgi:hypothetical protein